MRSRKDIGTAIRPEGEYETGEVVLYGQKNEAWKDDKLGTSVYAMGGSGCLSTCISSALSTEHEQTGRGTGGSPGELNELFGEYQVYNESGDIVWARLKEAVPGIEVMVASSVENKEIEELLAKGHYPIVKVKVGGGGAGHWVLVVGSRDGEYLCMDPLSENGELVPLSRHGGVAYRMRCVYWQE